MKKYLALLFMFSVFFITGGIVLALILNSINSPESSVNNNIDTEVTSTTLPTTTQKRRATIDLQKNNFNKYNLVIFNDGLEVTSFQLSFFSKGQFISFTVNPIFDATLANDFGTDNSVINLAFGKLNNRDKLNMLKTEDGGFIVGEFVLSENATSGDITLADDDEYNIVVDEEGSRGLEMFVKSIP